MKHPSKLVNVNDQVECIVLNVLPQERRISLACGKLASNPWDSLHDKFPVGTQVEGRVRNMTDSARLSRLKTASMAGARQQPELD